jgi:hypothetical protein
MMLVQWGGALTLFDTTTATQVTVRTFGAFDGTIAHPNGEAILQPMLLEAVRTAAAQQGGSVIKLDKDAIARAAQALLAPRLQELGAVGQLSIGAITFPPEEYERLMAAMAKAAAAKRAAMAAAADAPEPAPAQVSSDACTTCGASVPGKFCRECGTPRAAGGVAAAPAPAPAPAASSALAVGVSVRVQWSDGKQYPGVVQECRADQVLVGFPNGGMQWIPVQFVSPG